MPIELLRTQTGFRLCYKRTHSILLLRGHAPWIMGYHESKKIITTKGCLIGWQLRMSPGHPMIDPN